ncbi:MAG: hypothetical protein MI924_25770 [Chloroflexales bacterium]|nr:hypothetical protein [Chloroflexales bacterium]
MRIAPDHPRLRAVAVACWALGAWWTVQLGVASLYTHALSIAIAFLAIILFAIGVAFWLLGTDRRAGIVFDSKGLMLNLGHSAAFIAWDNIAAIGISRHRTSLLTLGSSRQLGIKLRDPQAYIQSYEERLPASTGLFAQGVRLLDRALRSFGHKPSAPTPDTLARLRARTGYDLLVPEALLGGKAKAFAELVAVYRTDLRWNRAPRRSDCDV